LTPKFAGEKLRYFMIADAATNMNFGNRCCNSTKLRWASGATRKPLAEALCRSTITYASGWGSRVLASILNELMLMPPWSWPLAR
jgi:hypothetical protein